VEADRDMVVKVPIKTVIFDLGKVIIPFDFNRGYRAMEQYCGYKASEIPLRIGSTDLVVRFETGMMEPEDFVRELSTHLDLKVSFDHFCEIWSGIFLPEPLLPDSMIEGLRRRYRVLLMSNTNAIHFRMIRERYPILEHFDDYVLSYQVKAMKPSPVIYNEAVRRAGCEAGECFFTDDIAAYVEGAKAVGIDAVQFQSRDQLEQELKARGIEW
jgi:glucose-1-phosphatase